MRIFTVPYVNFTVDGLPVPKSFNKRMTELCLSGSERPKSKPDLDNVAKAILDALNGVVYKDDSQICELFVKKMYCTKPRVEVFVWI